METHMTPQNNQASNISNVYSILEIISTVWFTLDYLLRLYTTPLKRLKFILKPFNIIDLISNLPFYVNLIITAASSPNKINSDIKSVLRIFQILRIVRVTKTSYGLKALVYTVKKSRKDLILLICLTFSSALILTSFVYLAEKDLPDTEFDSLPVSFYWGLITMTTVGYGDMYASSSIGKVLSAIIAVLGVLMFALPVAIFTRNFNDYFVYMSRREKALRNIKRKDAFKQKKLGNTIGWLGKKNIFSYHNAHRKH